MQAAILLPTVGMTAVVAAVWVKLYVDRVGEMKAKRIDTEQFKGPNNVKNSLENINASDNFKNLFELPVLFYVLCCALAITELGTSAMVTMAWIYVALRAAHSLVHVTYNRVMHRFLIYSTSGLLLFVMWAIFGLKLMAQ